MRILPGIKSVSHFCMIAVTLLVTSTSWAQNPEPGSPEQVVRRFHESLLEAMREGGRLGYRGRLELLAPAIDRSHDLDFIARITLGSHWTKLDPEQQRIFTDTFRQLSISSYAGWFKSHEGERFEFMEQQPMPREQVLVRSQLVQAKGEVVRFDYVLRQTKDGWRIINILADGVSDLALKRVEYRAVLERDGFPALIDMLKKKIVQSEQN
ncbi:MAG: HpnM family protein [Nitrosomonadaceae bacterium]|nr:HpnM family protein [Nitrosomonadaceae bacterium]